MNVPPPLPPHPELVLSAGSLRTLDIRERVAAAAAGGFSGLGLSARLFAAAEANGWTLATVQSLLDDYGVRLVELETLVGFASSGAADIAHFPGLRYGDRARESQLYALADAFGVRHVQVTGRFDGRLEDDAAERYAALCDRAATHGLLVALEFVPTTGVPDAATATRIVIEAGRPNGGVCIDTWHHFRGARDDGQLAAVPPDRVVMIQIDDGPTKPRHPDFLTDTVANRLPPGAGTFDLTSFLRLLWSGGANTPISVEVLSDELANVSARELAVCLGEHTRQVIARAQDLLLG